MQDDLVVRAQAGDVDAYSALTAGRTSRLYAVARLILRDGEQAEDAVQDALLQAWLDLRGLRDSARFDAWLHRLLVRACYRAAKRRRSREITEITAATQPPRSRRTPSARLRSATSSTGASSGCPRSSVP